MNDKMTELQWHLAEQDTKDFIEQLESIASLYGWHVGLTGGVLYKKAGRKDLDILLYCNGNPDALSNLSRFNRMLSDMEESLKIQFACKPEAIHWVVKATWKGKQIDFLTPQAEIGYYKRRDEIFSEVVL